MAVTPAQKRTATGSFAASGGSVSDYGTLMAGLNDFARASAQIYPSPPSTSATADIPYSKIASMLGQVQTRSMSQSKPAFNGSISTDSSTVTLTGHETGPSFAISPGSFNPGVNGVHYTALIQRLNMVLYIGSTSVIQDIKEPDIPKRILAIVQAVVRNWLTKVYPDMASSDKDVASQIHEMNTEPLQILQRILGSSTSHEIDGLAALAKSAPAVHQSINNWIYRSLTGSGDNFWGSFLTLAQSFGMIYAPDFGTSTQNGRLIGIREAFAAAEEKLECSSVQWSNTLERPDTPITHVVVPRVSSGHLRGYVENSKLMPGQTVQAFVRYPSGKYDGRGHIMSVPPFLGTVFQNVAASAAWGEAMQPGQLRDSIQKQADNVATSVEALRAFLTGLARRTLNLLQVQGVTANLQLPLDPSWQVGKAYTVGLEGQKLFTGLLAQCQHSVASSEGSPQAFTKLAFNHVQWGEYKADF